jgi:hypothetical protein
MCLCGIGATCFVLMSYEAEFLGDNRRVLPILPFPG